MKKSISIEITSSEGMVIFETEVDVEEGREGGFVRHLSSFLDEHYGEEED